MGVSCPFALCVAVGLGVELSQLGHRFCDDIFVAEEVETGDGPPAAPPFYLNLEPCIWSLVTSLISHKVLFI